MIIFLYGEDSYRSKQKLGEIIDGYKKVHKSGLNLIYADSKQNKFKDISDKFKIVSMFAEKKLVVLINVFSNVKLQEEFLEKISALGARLPARQGSASGGDDIVVVYEDGPVDQRTKLFKSLQKHAKCQEFNFLQPAMLRKWMAVEFAKNNVKIDFQAEALLCSYVGKNLWQMANEIHKLSNYVKNLPAGRQGGVVTKKDVENLVRPNIENDIFKTIDALASKNKSQALSLLHGHLNNGDNCLYLLSMTAYQFRNLLIIKQLAEAKIPYAMLAKKSGLHPFVVKKSYYLCNQFTLPQLKKIYWKIFQIDSDIKTGKIDAELALDLFVAELS